MNSITELLDLVDSEIFVSDIQIEGTRKLITLETHLTSHFCPSCGFRMHSRAPKVCPYGKTLKPNPTERP